MDKTLATMFTGGGLFDVGAQMAGYRHLWGIEFREDIAGVARANGLSVIVADVCDADPKDYETPYHLHASPPCPNFSVAKAGGKETDRDIAMAEAVCRFLRFHKPTKFTLENVYKYRLSRSFKLIVDTLEELGYGYNWKHINAADYGVPQTRRRLILISERNAIGVQFPSPTHSKKGGSGLLKWNGWYDAIEDLVPTLPETKFAKWQLARLPEEIKNSILVSTGNTSFSYQCKPGVGVMEKDSPSNSVYAHPNNPRAFIVDDENKSLLVNSAFPKSNGKKYYVKDGSSLTVDTQETSRVKAFILDGKPANYDGDLRDVDGGSPTPAITSSMEKHPFRAFLMPNENGSSAVSDDSREPSNTVGSTKRVGNIARAFVVDGRNGRNIDNGKLSVADDESPDWTLVGSSGGGRFRSWLNNGRVIKMTPRALARFQTVPDSYILPEKTSLACLVIGNGVPCLLAKVLLVDD